MKYLKAEFFLILIIFFIALTAYWLFDLFFLFLSLAVTSYLFWHLYQLQRFYSLFITHCQFTDPIPMGLWGLVYRSLSDRQDRWMQYRHNKRRIFSRFQQAFKRFPFAIVILDKTWKVNWYNHSCKKIFNSNTGIIHSKLSYLLNHPVIDEYIKAGDFQSPLEIQSPIDKASVLSLQFIPLSIMALSKEPFQLKEQETLLIIRDVTNTFHLDKIRKDFIANVTHELKTPLTVFKGFLEPMHEDIHEMPPQWTRSIELMYQQNLRMNDIVDELLLLSKLETSHGITSEKLINMSELLKKSVHDATLLAQGPSHQISIEAQENLILKGEIESIKMIINNLLVNAIKYTPQRSKITISWYIQSDQACLIVKDSGEGIAARHLSRLTERFYRIESGRSRDKGGTGLGLAIVNHALLRHQAELKINSEIGHGSTFICIFPKERTKIDQTLGSWKQ